MCNTTSEKEEMNIQETLQQEAPTLDARKIGFKPYRYPWLHDLPLYVLIEPNDAPVLVQIDENNTMYEYGETSPLLVIHRDVGSSEYVFEQFLKRKIIYRLVFPVSKKAKRKRLNHLLDIHKKTLISYKIMPAAAVWFMKKRHIPSEVQSMILGKFELSKCKRHALFCESIRLLNNAFNDIKSFGGYKGAMKILDANMHRTDWTKVDYDLVDSIEIYEACLSCNNIDKLVN